MKNPLIKRIPREFIHDITKYIAIFIMLVLLISMCSGMRVGNESLKAAYYESFDLYNIEDGSIAFDKELPETLLKSIENENDLKFYENFYFNEDTAETGSTIRVFRRDTEIDKPCLLSGTLPEKENEIAIDRVFAQNNDISVGDEITLKGKSLTVTGFIALPNYSTLFENNTDSMFDSINFSVAVMTDDGISYIGSKNTEYNYAWLYNTDYADDVEAAERSDKLLDSLEDVITDYDEEIVNKQVDDLTDKLEKAAEEYADIYSKSIEEKFTEISENIKTGAVEYATLLMTGKTDITKDDLSVNVDDYMFDIITKSVEASMTGSTYEIDEEELINKYSDEVKKPEKSELSTELDDFLFGIVEDAVNAEINGTKYEMPEDEEFENEIDKSEIISVNTYIPRYLNQGITFSIEDIGGDEAGTMIMCYMMIALIAFIFAVTISNTISSEAGVIGTLRASGYTKGELIRHYMALPIIVTLFSAVVGNILGYTVIKDYCVELYRNSYSLTTYKTVWDSSAFVLSTVIPFILMLIINLLVLTSKLKLSPLKFLRHDLKKDGNKKAMRLNTKIPFKTRFSLRIFFTNIPGYIVMIVGILFGSVIIAFGDMFPRMLDDYKEMITNDIISEYQYVLYDYENGDKVTDENAEKFAMTSFDFTKGNFLTDSVSVYGKVKDSKYINADIPDGKVFISTGLADKYKLNVGDTLTLDEKYKKDTSYTLEIGGIYDYESSLAIFINLDDYRKTFGEKSDYFTGYFSDNKLTELDDDDVATIITASDYTKLSDQLMVSMGSMMSLFKWFGAIFFVVVVYVLCKQVIEKNFRSIAMTKILGYRNTEIAALYIASTSVAVIIGLLITIPFIDMSMRAIFDKLLYTMMTGYISYIMNPMTYVVTILTGLICYIIVCIFQMRKVAKVNKSEALKDME